MTQPTPSDLVIRDEAAVRWLVLYRPASRNGLTPDVSERLAGAVRAAAADPAVRVIALHGEGGAFCSGLDLKAALGLAAQGVPVDAEAHLRASFHGLIRALRAAPQPVVAVVDGAAAGFGCDLALACDLRLCSDRARFGEVFVQRGLMPDGGATYHLPRLVGLGPALELMLTGELVDAAEAQRLGLANRVWPQAELLEQARAFLGRLAAGPPLVHRAVKAATYAALGGTLDAALDEEARGQLALLGSLDFAEGLTAFLEKRPPRFTGR